MQSNRFSASAGAKATRISAQLLALRCFEWFENNCLVKKNSDQIEKHQA